MILLSDQANLADVAGHAVPREHILERLQGYRRLYRPSVRELALDALLGGLLAAHHHSLRFGARLRDAQHKALAVVAGHLGIIRMRRLAVAEHLYGAYLALRMAAGGNHRGYQGIHVLVLRKLAEERWLPALRRVGRARFLGAQAGDGHGRVRALSFQEITHAPAARNLVNTR